MRKMTNLDEMNLVRDHLLSTELQYLENNLYRSSYERESKGDMTTLKDKILFVDEALPPNCRDDGSIQRLKFIRNFAQAFLCMFAWLGHPLFVLICF